MKIGLALSGGGVLGVAHIGLLEELDKRNISIGIVAGTSAGAIIGSLYCAGGVKMVHEFVAELEREGLFDSKRLILKPLPDLVFEKVRETLKKYLPKHFYDLDLKFICPVTNFSDGSIEILSHGNLTDSVMASSAFPGIFPAQEIEGKSYIDGGMTLNLPASAIGSKADYIIGSSLYDLAVLEKYDEVGVNPNRIDTARRSIEIMQKRLAEYERGNCDFYLTPPVETFNWFDLNKMNKIREIGQAYAKDNIDALIKSIEAKRSKGTFWQHLLHLK